jgi:hypothetical protein
VEGARAQRVQKGAGVLIAVSRRRSRMMPLVSVTPGPSPLLSSPSMSGLELMAVRRCDERVRAVKCSLYQHTLARKSARTRACTH